MIITENQMQLFREADRARLIKGLKLEGGEPNANQLQTIETAIEDDVELVKSMRDNVPTADELTGPGGILANDRGNGYTNWNLFLTVQYKNYDALYPTVKMGQGKYQLVVGPIWRMLGKQKQDEWRKVANKINEMKKTREPATYRKRFAANTKITCPLCLYSCEATMFQRHLDIHYPDHESNAQQRELFDELNEAMLTRDCVKEINDEMLDFWNALFAKKEDRSPEVATEIDNIKKLIKKAMTTKQKKQKYGQLYVQVQDATGNFRCNKDAITDIVKYVGKKSDKSKYRYFSKFTIGSRIGYEHKKAIESKSKENDIYIFPALVDIPFEFYGAFEQCVIMALFHLDKGKNNVWNINVEQISEDCKFRSLDPKILVKIGLYLLRTIIEYLDEAIAEKSFYEESKSVMEHYNSLDKAGQKDYIYRCGNYVPEENSEERSRYKKQKADIASELDAEEQLEQIKALAEAQIASTEPNTTFTADQMLEFAKSVLELTKLK